LREQLVDLRPEAVGGFGDPSSPGRADRFGVHRSQRSGGGRCGAEFGATVTAVGVGRRVEDVCGERVYASTFAGGAGGEPSVYVLWDSEQQLLHASYAIT
jgi:hypothetical protein